MMIAETMTLGEIEEELSILARAVEGAHPQSEWSEYAQSRIGDLEKELEARSDGNR